MLARGESGVRGALFSLAYGPQGQQPNVSYAEVGAVGLARVSAAQHVMLYRHRIQLSVCTILVHEV